MPPQPFDDDDDEEYEEEEDYQSYSEMCEAANKLFASYKEFARHELPSHVSAFYGACVGEALLNKTYAIDEIVFERVLDDFNDHFADSRFEKEVCPRTKQAYRTFYDIMEVFMDASPDDLQKHVRLIGGLMNLAGHCEKNATEVGYAKGRDLCRTPKRILEARIESDKKEYGENPFTIIGQSTLEICYDCPHRYRTCIDPDDEEW